MTAFSGRILLADSRKDQHWLHQLLADAQWPHPWPRILDFDRLLLWTSGYRDLAEAYLERSHAVAPPIHRAEADARYLWTALHLAVDEIGRERAEAALNRLIEAR